MAAPFLSYKSLMSNEHTSVEQKQELRLKQLQELRAQGAVGGGERRIEQQHDKGKLTARERLEQLVDTGTFQELDSFATHRATDFGLADQKVLGDAVVTGYGQVNGRQIFLFAQDFTVMGGSLSEVVAEKICKIMDFAMKVGAPVVGIEDSGGARIQEGIGSLKGYGDIFLRNTLASGVVPQLSVIMGPCAGGAVYSPAITDFIFMTEGTGQMYITGPDVIKAVTGEEVTHEQLGGADTHTAISGVAHFSFPDEAECIAQVRRLLDFIPSSNAEDPPQVDRTDDPNRLCPGLSSIIPEEANQSYDMKQVIAEVVDNGDFMEVQPNYAQNIIVGLGRLDGHPVGIVAQQPAFLAGVLDINASLKAARFVRFCDAFNIPILTFVDVPGFLPGIEQEHGGIIKHGAKLIYAYAEATVPKVSVLTRKAYGGGYIVMGSKHLRTDVNYAWPSAEIAVMGPEGAVNVIHREAISSAEDPDGKRAELIQEYRDMTANPYVAASRGIIDDVIDPTETRIKVIRSFEMLQNKRDTLPPKKHGNIPL
jgi:acetyl-CoA carboxylase carboxyltransferase component